MLNGVFAYDGLAGMVEAANIKQIDMISHFIVVLLDHTCAEFKTCPITAFFMEMGSS